MRSAWFCTISPLRSLLRWLLSWVQYTLCWNKLAKRVVNTSWLPLSWKRWHPIQLIRQPKSDDERAERIGWDFNSKWAELVCTAFKSHVFDWSDPTLTTTRFTVTHAPCFLLYRRLYAPGTGTASIVDLYGQCQFGCLLPLTRLRDLQNILLSSHAHVGLYLNKNRTLTSECSNFHLKTTSLF